MLLDDTSGLYWTTAEKYLAIQEFLLLWGGLTNYWRARGAFQATSATAPWYDLSLKLPALRTRTWTLGQMVRQIQYKLLENPSGVAGTGMSGQVTIADITQAIQRARNRLVLDVRLPLNVHSAFGDPPSPTGTFNFSQSSVCVHRAAWQDSYSGIWQNLWREDEWALDHANQDWTIEPTTPVAFSEASLAPLVLQLAPAPNNAGMCEAVTVDSLILNLASDAQTFGIPDEWVAAIQYGALAQILTGGNQIVDGLRAAYCEQRYQQLVDAAKMARSITRLQANGVPLTIDSLVALDAGNWSWRNNPVDLTQGGQIAGVLYDLVALPPPLATVGITADVIQSAPIPTAAGQYVPLGAEEFQNLFDYCVHTLLFKCGGNEFKSTFPQYDNCMRAVAGRGAINKVKIRYMDALLGQPQAEWAMRPDRAAAGA